MLAAHALEEENHADLGAAWSGLATVRRYQKGRRDDALAAYDAALAAAPNSVDVCQLISPDGSVRHGGEQVLGGADLFEEIKIDLPVVPVRVSRVVVCASVHEGSLADVVGLHVLLKGETSLVFEVPHLPTERAVVLFEFYRHGQAWKVRAIGQGYDDGLVGLARDYGVDVD